jgi:hypothetical protein
MGVIRTEPNMIEIGPQIWGLTTGCPSHEMTVKLMLSKMNKGVLIESFRYSQYNKA